MELGLEGKVALVTGASRGIGRATAESLAAEGVDIVAVATDPVRLAATRDSIERLGRRCAVHACDLRDAAACDAAVAEAIAVFGRLDVLVNSAGATKRGDFFQLTDADFDDGFRLKYMATVRLTRTAWPEMKRSGGTIVNIIGMGGRNASPDFTIGGSVNAALMNFTKAMALRGITDGVRVAGINPGLIATDRFKRRVTLFAAEHGLADDVAERRLLADHGIAGVGAPEDIGALVCYLAGRHAGYLQGTLVGIDGGESRGV